MSERRLHDVDTAIDRAVREIMGVDTDASFRARVLGKLHAPARREASWLRLGALLAAAAAVVLAVVLMRDEAPAPGPLADSKPAAQSAPAAAPAPAPTGQTAAIGRQETAPSTTQQPIPRRRPAPAQATNVTQAVRAGALIATVADVETPAVENPEPIAMPPLAPLTPTALVVEPLPQIPAIQIVPLVIPRPPQRN